MTDHSISAAQSPFPSIAPTLPEIGSDDHAPALTLNTEAYLHFLEDSDWTASQKREFIEALWSIVVSFVDMGFPVQQAKLNSQTLELESANVLDSMGISENKNWKTAFAKVSTREEEDS